MSSLNTHSADYSKVTVVVLAAGMSERMGDVNKLLIEVDGEVMIRRTVKLYLSLNLGKVLVVVGHQQAMIRSALSGLDVDFVDNPLFEQGQLSSIRRGLRALSECCELVLIALADLPFLTAADIERVLQSFDCSEGKTILVPYFKGQRGNPLLLKANQAREADDQGVHLGCRKLIDKHPQKVQRLDVDNHHYTSDLDTPEDVLRHLGIRLR